jgi:hypothetical protein
MRENKTKQDKILLRTATFIKFLLLRVATFCIFAARPAILRPKVGSFLLTAISYRIKLIRLREAITEERNETKRN